MRTNIEIDGKPMKDALRAAGAQTKQEAVELGLRTLIDLRAQEKARIQPPPGGRAALAAGPA